MIKKGLQSHSSILQTSGHLNEWWIDELGVWRYQGGYNNSHPAQSVPPIFPDTVKNEGIYYRHLGLIKVSITEKSIFIAWDVQSAALNAMNSLFDFLSGKNNFSQSFELHFCFSGWHREKHSSCQAAFERISQINSYRETAIANSIILSRQENLNPNRYDTLIREGLKAWKDGVFQKPDYAQKFIHSFSPYLLMFKPNLQNEQISLSYVGLKSAYTKALGKQWASHAISKPFYSDTPDEDYSTRIGKVYAEVLESGEPRLDHIMALIHSDESDPVWWPYQRLLVPFHDTRNKLVLLCLSTIKEEIDIPFMAGA